MLRRPGGFTTEPSGDSAKIRFAQSTAGARAGGGEALRGYYSRRGHERSRAGCKSRRISSSVREPWYEPGTHAY